MQAPALAALINRIIDGTISNKIAREVFGAMWAGENGGQPDAIIEARGLKQISDTGAIGAMIDEVLAANAAIVEEYRAGKQKAFTPGRPDHEGRPRQGQPATGQRPAQAAGRLTGSALYQTTQAAAYCRGLLLAKNGRVDIRLETRAMTMPYLSVPLEQVAARLDEMIRAARDGAYVVITHDGQAHARICEVNPLLTEEAHQAIEDLKNFPRSPYTDKATWWYVVKGIHV